MISFRRISYDTETDIEVLLSRLNWAVEEDNLWYAMLQGQTPSTSKDWAGIINTKANTFKIMETGKFFNIKIFQIIIRGRFERIQNGTRISIKFRLGWFMIMWLLMAFVMGALLLSTIFSIESASDLIPILFGVLLFPGLTGYLYWRKLNKTELKLEKLLGID